MEAVVEERAEVIEVLDTDDEDERAAERAAQDIPAFEEEEPPLSAEMAFVKVRLNGGVAEDVDEEGLWWPSNVRSFSATWPARLYS